MQQIREHKETKCAKFICDVNIQTSVFREVKSVRLNIRGIIINSSLLLSSHGGEIFSSLTSYSLSSHIASATKKINKKDTYIYNNNNNYY